MGLINKINYDVIATERQSFTAPSSRSLNSPRILMGKISIPEPPEFNAQMSVWWHASDKPKRVLRHFLATWAFHGR